MKRFTLREYTHEEYNKFYFDTKKLPSEIDSHEVTWIGEPITIEEIKLLCDSCPACTLAILRQTKLNHHYFHLKFDFKGELESYMKEKKRIQHEEFIDTVGYPPTII